MLGDDRDQLAGRTAVQRHQLQSCFLSGAVASEAGEEDVPSVRGPDRKAVQCRIVRALFHTVFFLRSALSQGEDAGKEEDDAAEYERSHGRFQCCATVQSERTRVWSVRGKRNQAFSFSRIQIMNGLCSGSNGERS